jgi:signal transduction histidine kinase/ligand-binding sensor domain-containing protein/DNA-binding response OmpR family regulator
MHAGAALRTLLVAALRAGTARAAQAQPRPEDPRTTESSPTYVHEQWTVRDGLPVNSVNALLQSRSGYLWIGTFDGLVRFDGVRMQVFNASNSPGLESNRVLALRETADGALWLWTELGTLIRLRDGVFTPFGATHGLTHDITALHSDRAGVLWAGTPQGLLVLRGDRFEAVARDVITAPVRHIMGRDERALWVATQDYRLFQVRAGIATPVPIESSVAGDAIVAMAEHDTGALLVATASGWWRVANGSGAAERLRTMPQPDGAPTHLLADSTGTVIHSVGSALYRNGARIYDLRSSKSRPSAPAPVISSIVQDHEGSLWFGTSGAGLHRLKRAPFRTFSEAEGLSYRSVQSVFEDTDGSLLIGTWLGGTNRLQNDRITALPEAAGFPSTTLSFLRDRTGLLWVGGGSGLRICPSPTAACVPADFAPVQRAATYAMHEDADGTLWFGTSAGLVTRDPRGRWKRMEPADGAPTAIVRAFTRTRDGALWMGTAGGGLLRHQRGRFTHIGSAGGLPIDLVRSLYEDADGWLWVGTEGRGLVRIAPATCADARRCGMVPVGTEHGLHDAIIHQMLEDDDGRLWMSGNRGISWVPRSQLLAFAEGTIPRVQATVYTERDGMRNREANGGSQPAGARTRDGRLWFPTQDGVVMVDPRSIPRNVVPPRVMIETVSAGGAAVPRADGAFTLARNQRDVEIGYTALSFLAPDAVRFRYRLDELGPAWTEADTRRTAYFTNLPPRRYTFRVIASNNDGVWNEVGATELLHVTPYWHETGLARVLFALGLIGAVEGGRRWRVGRLKRRADELHRLIEASTATLRQREAQLARQNTQLSELHEARSRLFANLTHEFRSPLTLILGPLRSLLDGRHGTLQPTVREQGALMLRSGERLLNLTNQVLELVRVQSGALVVNRQRVDLVAFTRDVVREFQALADARGVGLRFGSQEAALDAHIDADHLEKALFNVLSNALKFTPRGGDVHVVVQAREGTGEIVVHDSGIGVAPADLPRVFDRYFQAHAPASVADDARVGSGIGLALTRELVEQLGGVIRAESTPGVGSTFTIALPLGDAATASDATRAPSERAERHGAPAEPVANTSTAHVTHALDRTTVLIVDDDADMRAFVRSVLSPAYHVLEATDGQSALASAREALPDLIVADVVMPGLDGLALGRALKEAPMTEAIPLILLTARAAPVDQVAGLEAGADAYLVKPFEPSVLEAQVESLLAQRHRLRALFREPAPPPPPPVDATSELERRLRPLVEQHLTDSSFGPEALAHAAGLSYHQLYRALRDELAMSPSRFIRTVRVERAAALLRQRLGSVTEVAYASGFESLSYFSRVFRERFGTTPSDYAAGAPPVSPGASVP